MIDRFGLLPTSVKQLILITELKLLATVLGITRIHAAAQNGKIEFNDNANINAGVLISLIQVHAKRYQMEGPSRLRFTLDSTGNEERIHEIRTLLGTLQNKS